ncbi:MAG: WD40 repeat domain-containing protein [Polyangiales bacterium]
MDRLPLRARRATTLGEATLALARTRCVLFAHDGTDTLWIGTERGVFGFAVPTGAPRGANPTLDCRAIAAEGDTLLLVGQKNVGTLDARTGARGPAIESGLNQWSPHAALGSPARVLYGQAYLRWWEKGRVRKLFEPSPAKRWTVSPGGVVAAGVTRKKTAALVDLATRVELPAPGVAKVSVAHALDDGAVLLATGDGALVLWDLAAAREARRWRFKRPVIALASTRDGRTIAAVTDDALWVIDRAGGVRELARGRFLAGVALVEGARWVAARVGACAAQVFDGRSGEALCGGSLAEGPIAAVRWPLGERVAVQAEGDPVVRVWDVAAGEHTAVDLGAAHRHTELSPDGARLAVLRDGGVQVVEVASGAVAFEHDFARLTHLAWAPDGDSLVVGGGGDATPSWVARWPLGRAVAWRHQEATRRTHVSGSFVWLEGLWVRGGDVIFAVENELRLLTLADGAPTGQHRLMNWAYLTARMPWPDAGAAIVRGTHEVENGYDYVNELACWDLAHESVRWSRRLDATGASALDDGRARCAVSSRDQVLVHGCADGALLARFTLAGESDEVTALAFAPDGRLAVGTRRGLVHVYALEA